MKRIVVSRGLRALSLLSLVVTGRAEARWNRFRGPNGSGVDSASGYPVEFSPSKNLVWKTSVPYETPLATYDKDADARLSLQEFRGDPDLGEHFGWLDTNEDNFIDAAEWNEIHATPALDEGRIYVRTRSSLYCFGASPSPASRQPRVVVGTLLEERKLVHEFGDTYASYQERVSMFVPLKWLRSRIVTRGCGAPSAAARAEANRARGRKRR